jgi:hypothetical protein
MKNTIIILLSLLSIGCNKISFFNNETYTLYRESVVEDRVHVATFDTQYGAEHNQRVCNIAKDLFEADPGVTVKFWCEKGTYRK